MSYWRQYKLDCKCKQKVEETIQRKISEAQKIEYEQKKRLEQFQKGIREGAVVIISKMIYKMSIYMTSKANDCRRDISTEQIQNVLDQQVAKIPELSSFYGDNRTVILHYNSLEKVLNYMKYQYMDNNQKNIAN